MTKEELIKFTDEIVEVYEAGKIHAPCHFSGGNEEALIKIFENINKNDWILSTWRSHYHWLLSGRDKEELRKQILEEHSMHIYGNKFFTSAIVGGIAPIAVGIAMGIKRQGDETTKVWCFLGDMAYSGGLAKESIRYATGHDLPVIFVVENNCRSVTANTKEVWGNGKEQKVIRYDYKPKYRHAGHGLEGGPVKYVMF